MLRDEKKIKHMPWLDRGVFIPLPDLYYRKDVEERKEAATKANALMRAMVKHQF